VRIVFVAFALLVGCTEYEGEDLSNQYFEVDNSENPPPQNPLPGDCNGGGIECTISRGGSNIPESNGGGSGPSSWWLCVSRCSDSHSECLRIDCGHVVVWQPSVNECQQACEESYSYCSKFCQLANPFGGRHR
jgi:hypothetical protein